MPTRAFNRIALEENGHAIRLFPSLECKPDCESTSEAADFIFSLLTGRLMPKEGTFSRCDMLEGMEVSVEHAKGKPTSIVVRATDAAMQIAQPNFELLLDKLAELKIVDNTEMVALSGALQRQQRELTRPAALKSPRLF